MDYARHTTDSVVAEKEVECCVTCTFFVFCVTSYITWQSVKTKNIFAFLGEYAWLQSPDFGV